MIIFEEPMNVSFYIAKRYLFSKNENNAITIISRIASIGVIFGSLLLLVVLSGFEGLKTFSLSYTNIVDPDYKVLPASGKKLLLTSDQHKQLSQLNTIASLSQVIEENAYAQYRDKNELIVFKAVDVHYNSTTAIDSTLFSGTWLAPESYQSVAGAGLAYNLELGVFNYAHPLEVFVPKPGKGQINQHSFKKIELQNIGLIDINEELNNTYLYLSLKAGQDLMGYNPRECSYIEIKTLPDVTFKELKKDLKNILGKDIVIKNRSELNDTLHKMLNTENVAVYVIFTLILIVALFNVIGAIIMMIIDKKKNLKTLHHLGASIPTIKQIFFLQGSLLTIVGGTLGVLIAILLISCQMYFEFIKIPGTELSYPVELSINNITIVLATIFILGLSASKIASYRISKKLL